MPLAIATAAEQHMHTRKCLSNCGTGKFCCGESIKTRCLAARPSFPVAKQVAAGGAFPPVLNSLLKVKIMQIYFAELVY